MTQECLIKKILTKTLKILGIALLLIILIIFLGLNIHWYYNIESVSKDADIIQTINDESLDYKLDLYYLYSNGSYWLMATNKKTGKEKLIMRDGDINGELKISVISKNIIELDYDYDSFKNSYKNDEKIILDLEKGQTHNLTFIRRILE